MLKYLIGIICITTMTFGANSKTVNISGISRASANLPKHFYQKQSTKKRQNHNQLYNELMGSKLNTNKLSNTKMPQPTNFTQENDIYKQQLLQQQEHPYEELKSQKDGSIITNIGMEKSIEQIQKDNNLMQQNLIEFHNQLEEDKSKRPHYFQNIKYEFSIPFGGKK